MKVYFWRSVNKRVLQCRRGKNIYRLLDIPANVDVAEYNPLINSIVELIDQGMVIGTAEIGTVADSKIMLQSTDNLEQLVESVPDPDSENQSTEETIDVESSSKESVDDKVSDESSSESKNTVQRVVNENIDNAGTLSGTVEVQISSVAERDDGLNDSGKYRPEGSPDGLYSDNDGVDVAQDRSGEAVDSISSSDESPSSD